MPTYTIVAQGTDPLGPHEISAGSAISASDGDTYILSASADSSVTFVSASAGPIDFDLLVNVSNANGFDLKFESGVTPTISIADNVDIGGIKIDAKKADGLVLDAGNGVTLRKMDGSDTGPNTATLGDDFTITESWTTGNDNDILIVGDRATFQDIDLRGGDDTIRFGDDATANKVKTGDGDDRIFIANDARINQVDGGNGFDTLNTASTAEKESNIDKRNVVCFAAGTLIDTEDGPVPVEALSVGQRVCTADHGLQRLRWIGSNRLSAAALRHHPRLAPVRIPPGRLGHGLPRRDLTVSPQHRICIRSPIAQRMFGSAEIFLTAGRLTELSGIDQLTRGGITYFHLLFDRHELVFAEGLACESLYLGPQAIDALGRVAMQQIDTLRHRSGGTLSADRLARPCPKRGAQIRQLLHRHAKNEKPLIAGPPAPAMLST